MLCLVKKVARLIDNKQINSLHELILDPYMFDIVLFASQIRVTVIKTSFSSKCYSISSLHTCRNRTEHSSSSIALSSYLNAALL